MNAPQKAPRLVASVLARILDRPNAAFYGDMPQCDCDGCAAIRDAGMSCAACGFQGAPVVMPCQCRETRASNMEFANERIAELRSLGVEQDLPGDYCLGDLLEILHQNESQPDAMCTPDANGEYCSHGAASWPRCSCARMAAATFGVRVSDLRTANATRRHALTVAVAQCAPLPPHRVRG